MKTRVDKDRIARGLGAERRGSVSARGGFFGALQLATEVAARFRSPARGGRATDPSWTKRRLVPLAPRTLERLEALSARIREQGSANLEAMQLAGLLLEEAAEKLSDTEAERLVPPKRSAP